MRDLFKGAAKAAAITVVCGFAVYVAAPHYGDALTALRRLVTTPVAWVCVLAGWIGWFSLRQGVGRARFHDSGGSGWATLAFVVLGVGLVGAAGYGLFLVAGA